MSNLLAFAHFVCLYIFNPMKVFASNSIASGDELFAESILCCLLLDDGAGCGKGNTAGTRLNQGYQKHEQDHHRTQKKRSFSSFISS